jgi:hypothetical protein
MQDGGLAMRCIATVAAGFIALIAPASAQDSRLKVALTAFMTRAMTHPLPQTWKILRPLSTRARGNQRRERHDSPTGAAPECPMRYAAQ